MKIKALSRSIEAYQPAGANVPKQPRNLVSTGRSPYPAAKV